MCTVLVVPAATTNKQLFGSYSRTKMHLKGSNGAKIFELLILRLGCLRNPRSRHRCRFTAVSRARILLKRVCSNTALEKNCSSACFLDGVSSRCYSAGGCCMIVDLICFSERRGEGQVLGRCEKQRELVDKNRWPTCDRSLFD